MDMYGRLVKYIIHPLWMMKDNKYRIYNYLNAFEKSQYLSHEEIQEHQFVCLRKLLSHAYEHCPFYHARFDKEGIHPDDIKDFNDYLRIPLLTKGNIQEYLSELVAANYPINELVPNKTGGSTGKPILYYHDKERMISMEASGIRHDRWAGYDIGDKLALIWGHRRDISIANNIKGDIRDKVLTRKRFLDSSSITEEMMAQYVQSLRRFKPRTILAYANAAYLFAQYCHGNKITDIRPHSIITSAEVLHDVERDCIEQVFGCKVFNRYGCREVAVIASECPVHSGLHINADALYVEFIKSDGSPAEPGELGQIVITDLLNVGMPFIRYKIEDTGIKSISQCTCGRSLPIMEMVGGRVTDFLVTPEGVRVSGSSITIYLIANTPGVKQAQFIQEKKDLIIMKLVRGKDFNEESISFLNKKIPEFFGNLMKVEYEYVEEIPKESSGKFRFSICKIG